MRTSQALLRRLAAFPSVASITGPSCQPQAAIRWISSSSTQQDSSSSHSAYGALLGAASAAGAFLYVQGWGAHAEGKAAAADPVITISLPGGSKVEVMPPASGSDWEVKVERAKEPAGQPQAIDLGGPFHLPPPPFPLDALEPYMSRTTLEVHWGKHHRTYCENLNKQVGGTDLAGKSLEQVVLAAWNNGKTLPCFNNAAQVWNHTFFWDGMKPGGGGSPKPGGDLAVAIERDFGGLMSLRKELQTAGMTQFGSGWAWLVADEEGKLHVIKTVNAVSPIVTGWKPLLAIDVWEHAYYLDHQNRRADYISIFLDHLVDWEAVEKRYIA